RAADPYHQEDSGSRVCGHQAPSGLLRQRSVLKSIVHQANTSLSVTVESPRFVTRSASWPKQWVTVGRLACASTICWAVNERPAQATRFCGVSGSESPTVPLQSVIVVYPRSAATRSVSGVCTP